MSKAPHANSKSEVGFAWSFFLLIIAVVLSVTVFFVLKPAPTSDASVAVADRPKKAKPMAPMMHLRSQEDLGDAGNTLASAQSTSIKSNPAIESKVKEAMQLVDSGQANDALKVLEDVLKLDPNNATALTELGLIHLIDLHDTSAAINYIEQAVRADPSNKTVVAELVGLYQETGQTESGLNTLQGMYDKDPGNPALAGGIGQMLASMDRPTEAVTYLEIAAKNGKSDNAYTELADAYSAAGQGEKAIQTYRQRVAMEDEASAGTDIAASLPGAASAKKAMLQLDLVREYLAQNKVAEAEAEMGQIKSHFNDPALLKMWEDKIAADKAQAALPPE